MCAFQAFSYGIEYTFDFNVHANPLRTRSSMTVLAAAYVRSLDADVVSIRTAVAPPFGWSQQPHDGSAHGNCQMRRSRLAAHIDLGFPRESTKPFERKGDNFCLP